MNKSVILLAFAAVVCVASCKKSDNNSVTTTSVTYTNSFSDRFVNDSSGWTKTNAANNTSIFVGGGYLNFIYHPATSVTYTDTINAGFDTQHDFSLQTSVQSDNALGLSFGATAKNHGYAFEVDNNGNYGLFVQGDSVSGRSPILNWTKTPAANPGGVNMLELDQVNGVWYGMINNVKIFSVTARPVYGSTIGFVVEPNTNGTASYITVNWN